MICEYTYLDFADVLSFTLIDYDIALICVRLHHSNISLTIIAMLSLIAGTSSATSSFIDSFFGSLGLLKARKTDYCRFGNVVR